MANKNLINNKKLMDEWDWNKNQNLDPSTLPITSEEYANWICKKCGHEWNTQIYIRQNHGCPKCGHLKTAEANSKPKKGKSLADCFPDIIKEWHPTKNGNLTAYDFAPNSNKKVWWKCSKCGYEWPSEIFVRYRSKHLFCKKCNLKRAVRKPKKGKDLLTLYPEVASEWDYKKNYPLNPSEICSRSEKSYFWKCKNGHEWEEKVYKRTNNNGKKCPYCPKDIKKKRKINISKSLAVLHPELLKIWDDKNNTVSPYEVSSGSHTKVYWKCNKNHSYPAVIKNVVKGTRCPYCSNQKVLVGFNDLETWCKNNNKQYLLKEWHPTKNGTLTPQKVVYGYTKNIWWQCELGHEWSAPISRRTNGTRTANCPCCSNRKLLKGFNDLATKYPEIAKEWHPTKNGTLTPQDVLFGSSKKVWWQCEFGHEWPAFISSRIKGHFCKKCDSRKHVSLAEKTIVFYLKKAGIEVIENKQIDKKEIDIFLPKKNIGIEYDGQRWHKDKNKDLGKNALCRKKGITLYRIREPLIGELNDTSIDIVINHISSNINYMNDVIRILFEKLQINYNDINVERDLPQIYQLLNSKKNGKSIVFTHPEVANEWHPTKNGELKPENCTKGQHLKVWWLCSKCKNEYPAWIYARCHGSGCKLCAQKRISAKLSQPIIGENDLATTHPQLAKEWDYEKNYPLTPQMVKAGSDKEVWWLCEKKHSFYNYIYNRKKGENCPYCSGRKKENG